MRTTLLALCGLSPQVITETLYALIMEGKKPDAIKVITTREGKESINAHLLNPETGQFYQLLREFGIITSLNIMILYVLTIVLLPITFSFLAPPSQKHLKHLDNS